MTLSIAVSSVTVKTFAVMCRETDSPRALAPLCADGAHDVAFGNYSEHVLAGVGDHDGADPFAGKQCDDFHQCPMGLGRDDVAAFWPLEFERRSCPPPFVGCGVYHRASLRQECPALVARARTNRKDRPGRRGGLPMDWRGEDA